MHAKLSLLSKFMFLFFSGCGSGKYLGINKQIYKIGSDCCSTLVNIAHCADHEAMVCDNIRLPYRDNSFDAVISIAVIHHFATTERRAQALNELARICRPGGQIMIYVWAMEQKLRKVSVLYHPFSLLDYRESVNE